MDVGNGFAYLMLVIWPVVAWQFYRHMPPAQALLWTILGGYMALPPVVAINFPMVPDFDKFSVANLSALLAVLFLLKERFNFWPKNLLFQILMVLYVAGPFVTVLTNSEALYFQTKSVPGLRFYDSFAAVTTQLIFLLPYFMARKYLSSPEGMEKILYVLVMAGFIYSIPMLFEVRFSPQLNVMIYGFFQHDFSQAIRFGGFRPFVFMPHGLWVAFFAFMCLMAATWRLRSSAFNQRTVRLITFAAMAGILFICKSAGSMIYGILLVPVVLILPLRAQMMVATAAVCIVVTYPMLRGLDLVPVDAIVKQAYAFDAERGASLEFRVMNETLLLERAQEKSLFGWGGYGRNFLHDLQTGEISLIADGGWILTLGVYGWVGYVSEFGLLAIPVLLFWRETRKLDPKKISGAAVTVALILAANMVDLLPNDTLIPFTWLLSGALWGHAEALARQRKHALESDFQDRFRQGRTIL